MFYLNAIRDGFRSVTGRRADGPPVITTRSIDKDRDEGFVGEQMRVYAGMNLRRLSPFTDNFTDETPAMRIKYRYALAEPTVKAALLGKIISVCSLNLQMVPKNKSDPKAHEVAACTRHGLAAGPWGIPGLIWEILIGGLVDGWSVSNKVYGIEDRGQYAGKKVLKNLKGKDTRFIWPEVDEYRNVTALWNFRGNAGRRFDPSDFVVFSYLSIFQNPLGMSDLRSSYRAIELIPVILNLRSIFLEKFAGPYMVGKISDRSLKAKMHAELQKARAKGIIVVDKDSDIEVIDMATRGTADFQACIEDLRQEVAIGISGAFLHMLTGMNPEARGSSKVQQDTTEAFIWILSEQVRAVIQKSIVPDLVDYNHGALTDLPDVALEAVNPEDIVKELGIDKLLKELGIDQSKKAILDRARRTGPDANDPADIVKGNAAPANDPSSLMDRGGLNFPQRFAERLGMFSDDPPFTGTITDSLGRKIKFVGGHRVKGDDTDTGAGDSGSGGSDPPPGYTHEGKGKDGATFYRAPSGDIIRKGTDGVLRFHSKPAPWESLGKKLFLDSPPPDPPAPASGGGSGDDEFKGEPTVKALSDHATGMLRQAAAAGQSGDMDAAKKYRAAAYGYNLAAMHVEKGSAAKAKAVIAKAGDIVAGRHKLKPAAPPPAVSPPAPVNPPAPPKHSELHTAFKAHKETHGGQGSAMNDLTPEQLQQERDSADKIVAELGKLSKGEVAEFVKAAGVESIGGQRSKKALIKAAYNHLTSRARTYERAEA